MITISKGNSKMGAVQSFSLPAGITCNPKAPCYGKCYARRMEARRKNVKRSYERNYEELLTYPELVKAQIKAAAITQRSFRFHVSGDIVSEAYFEMMIEIAREVPTCHFMAFTKQYEIVNAWLDTHKELPANLQILFSVWSGFPCPNPHNLPEAHILMKNGTTTLPPDKPYYYCTGNCTECILENVGCWNLAKGEAVLLNEH